MGRTLMTGPTQSLQANSVIAPLVGFVWFSGVMGLWVFPAWLLAVLPLALLVRENSRFWHPLICGPVGLLVGGGIFLGSITLLTSGSGELQIRSIEPLAAIACVAGLLTALVLAYLFRTQKPLSKSFETTGEV
ncbi:MAG TPA: hypothetical protein VHE61_15875 [Opitutaceae bacterium]|nr:hypothetical protein [Opitutaceae bacterium]